MAYKLFLDKNNLFECDIQLQGASIKNSFARIILESNDYSYVFKGEIDQNGHCSVEINKLKNLFENNESGSITLEVVADDVYFSPWSDTYQTDLSKKIDVVVKEQEEPVKPTISVSVKQPILKETAKPVVKEQVKESVKPKVENKPTKVTKPTSSESSIKVSDIKKILSGK
jgi:hypothetical protein